MEILFYDFFVSKANIPSNIFKHDNDGGVAAADVNNIFIFSKLVLFPCISFDIYLMSELYKLC